MKYSLIHVPKTGGCALSQILTKNYPRYFVSETHMIKCHHRENPIIVVRDVFSRFLSIFNYWKNGSLGRESRDKTFINKNKNINILDFITMLKNKDTKNLYVSFTQNVHFMNTVEWIRPEDYKKTIIIKYTNDLEKTAHKLLQYLEIPIINKKININDRTMNISTKMPEDHEIYETHKEYIHDFVRDYFKCDIELMNTIDKNPELFKLVIYS